MSQSCYLIRFQVIYRVNFTHTHRANNPCTANSAKTPPFSPFFLSFPAHRPRAAGKPFLPAVRASWNPQYTQQPFPRPYNLLPCPILHLLLFPFPCPACFDSLSSPAGSWPGRMEGAAVWFMWHTRSATAKPSDNMARGEVQMLLLNVIFYLLFPSRELLRTSVTKNMCVILVGAWLKNLNWANKTWSSKRYDQPLVFSGCYCQIMKLCSQYRI